MFPQAKRAKMLPREDKVCILVRYNFESAFSSKLHKAEFSKFERLLLYVAGIFLCQQDS